MSSIAKKLGLFIAIISMSFGVVSVMGDEPVVPITQISQDSSLYDFSTGSAARIEDERVIAPSEFLSLNSDDEIRLRNESFELFYNDQTTGIKVRNLETGYVWNSVIDDADAGTFNGLLSSSIGFEYINIAQIGRAHV